MINFMRSVRRMPVQLASILLATAAPLHGQLLSQPVHCRQPAAVSRILAENAAGARDAAGLCEALRRALPHIKRFIGRPRIAFDSVRGWSHDVPDISGGAPASYYQYQLFIRGRAGPVAAYVDRVTHRIVVTRDEAS